MTMPRLMPPRRTSFGLSFRPPAATFLPEIAEGSGIPRLIHQTYPTKSLPTAIEDNIKRITEANPNWQHRLYDDEDIVDFIGANYGPAILSYYHRINPNYGAARADLFRYLLIYKLGGVYLDIKATLTRPLNEVMADDDRYLLSHWHNGPGEEFEGWGKYRETRIFAAGEFQQWHIVAAPGHPFLRAVILRVLRNIDRYNLALHHTGKFGVIRVTGPIAYTLAIAPLLHLYPHRVVDSEGDLGFVYSIFGQAHKAIFKMHYSDLTEPIVRIGAANRRLAAAITLLKRAKRWLKAGFGALVQRPSAGESPRV